MSTNSEKDKDLEIMGCVGNVLTLPVLVVYLTILKAVTLMLLWEWFVVSYFDAAPLTIPVAAGLGLIASLFTFRYSEADTQATEAKGVGVAERYAAIFVRPTVVFGLNLFIGWIVTLFMN